MVGTSSVTIAAAPHVNRETLSESGAARHPPDGTSAVNLQIRKTAPMTSPYDPGTYGQPQPPHQGEPYQGQPYQVPPQPVAPQYPVPPQMHGQQYQPVVYVQTDNGNNTSLAPVTSLVTGLIALFTAWIPIFGMIAWVLGPLALLFGILGLKRGKAEHKIMSMIGLIAGAIALLICFIYVFVLVLAASDSGSGT